LPIKAKPTTSLLSASCLLTFSDNSEARFFCTTQLLKVNFPFRSFYHPFRRIALTIHSNRNVSLLHSLRGQKEWKSKKKNFKKNRVNLAIKKLTALKWVCVNAVNNALN